MRLLTVTAIVPAYIELFISNHARYPFRAQ